MNTTTLRYLVRLTLVAFLAVSGMRAAAQVDCLGVDGGPALPGTPCDDWNTHTPVDIWSVNCQCEGFCNGGYQPGSTCQDGNALTINDQIWWDCGCAGTGTIDCMGVEFGQAYIGTPCDDNDPATLNDRWSSYCACIGESNDCLGIMGGSAVFGTPCEDNDPFTNNDHWAPGNNGCLCQGQTTRVSGRVFLDRNGDGMFNLYDFYWPGRVVEVYRAGHPSQFVQTYGQGNYQAVLDTGTYGLRVVLDDSEGQGIADPVITFSAYGASNYNNDIPLIYTGPVNDLALGFWVCNPYPRPGFDNKLAVIVRNLGNEPLPGTVQLTYDPLLSYVSMYPADGTVDGNTIAWEFDTIPPGWTASAHVWLHTDSAIALGTPIAHTASLSPPFSDDRPANDLDTAHFIVVGSYDPNDKLVSPGALTPTDVVDGTTLTYTIRFQNTGTSWAQDVRLSDTLSPLLDHSTFEFVGCSHPSQWSINDGVLAVLYDQIMLPDSGTNEPGSHGYFMFRMKPQDFLLPGASVMNSASIYFDFNQPIRTNNTVVSVELITGVTPSAAEIPAISLWPNPVIDMLNIKVAATSWTTKATIIDVNGRIVRSLASVAVQDRTLTIPVADLADGLYTLRIGDGLKACHQRFVKSH